MSVAAARPPRRAAAAVLAAVLGFLAGTVLWPGQLAQAYWTASGSGSGVVNAADLGVPTQVTATALAWVGRVTLTWAAAETSSGEPATGYVVRRLAAGGSSPACGTSTASPTSALTCLDSAVPDGPHRYDVTAIYHGWSATSAPSDVTTVAADGVAPTVTVTTSPAAGGTGYHRTSPVTVTVAATDTGPSGVDHVTTSLDGAPAVDTPGAQKMLTLVSEGTHTLVSSATDGAGNTSSTTTTTVRIDTVPPGVVLAVAAGQSSPTSASALSFTASFSEPVTGFTGSDVVVGGTAGQGTAHVTGSGTSYTITVDQLTTDGTVSVAVPAGAAQDAAGNPSTAAPSVGGPVVRDTTPPATPPAPSLTTASDSGSSATDGVTNVVRPTVTGSAEPGSIVTVRDGSTVVGTAVAAGGSYTATLDLLSEGQHSLTVRATDAAGNLSPASPVRTVTIDTQPPVLVLSAFTAVGRTVVAAGTGSRAATDLATVSVIVCRGVGPVGTTAPSFPCAPPDATLTASIDPLTGLWTITSGTLAASTSYFARAQQLDLAGNLGVSPVSPVVLTGIL